MARATQDFDAAFAAFVDERQAQVIAAEFGPRVGADAEVELEAQAELEIT